MLPSLASAQELLLFGGDNHDQFLGCLNCNEFSTDSICNEFGAGNEFGPGIFNEFSTFGSEFSSLSPWNEFTTSTGVPVVVDKGGNFYGYFTINSFRHDAVSNASDLKKLFDIAEGDLEIVRKLLCAQ